MNCESWRATATIGIRTLSWAPSLGEAAERCLDPSLRKASDPGPVFHLSISGASEAPMHVRVWKFRPPEGREREFAAAYSGTGRWAALFNQAPGFRGTTLLRPAEDGSFWMTLDRWDSLREFEAFAEAFRDRYHALDAELEGIAGDEEFVGAFEEEG